MQKRILIVEDDPFIAMDLQDTLEDAGYEVLGPVAAVKSGLKLMEQASPDFAMLDYNLGRETSVEIAHQLESENIPFVFLSGQACRVIAKDLDSPCEVIPKPFDPNKLLKRVSALVEEFA